MDDLIDRQAAINALRKALFKYEDDTEKKFLESPDLDICDWIEHRIFVQNMNDIDVQAILNLPSAEPERGQWNDIGGIIRFGCPFCHHAYETKSNFCPNCGADMREEQE